MLIFLPAFFFLQSRWDFFIKVMAKSILEYNMIKSEIYIIFLQIVKQVFKSISQTLRVSD